jgi:hypothetical protein
VGIRESLNQNPAITTGVTIGIIVVVLVIIFLQLRGPGAGGAAFTKAFYSVNEDGSDWFVDDITKDAPFDHNGKQAHRVYLFTCDGGKTKFVGYMERFTKAGLEKINKAKADAAAGKQADIGDLDMLREMEVEVKGPKTGWIRRADPRAGEVMNIKCPDGTQNNLDVVFP